MKQPDCQAEAASCLRRVAIGKVPCKVVRLDKLDQEERKAIPGLLGLPVLFIPAWRILFSSSYLGKSCYMLQLQPDPV